MFKLTLLLCAQALLIQSVFSQCAQRAAILPAVNSCGCGGSSIATGGLSAANGYDNVGLISGVNSGYGTVFGGTGEGQLAAEGTLGVSGNTKIVGSLPVMGVVQFAGDIWGSGLVSIVGSTSSICGYSSASPCSSGYLY